MAPSDDDDRRAERTRDSGSATRPMDDATRDDGADDEEAARPLRRQRDDDDTPPPPRSAVTTSCGHAFCVECLLESARYSGGCPLCRAVLHDCPGHEPRCALCLARVPRGYSGVVQSSESAWDAGYWPSPEDQVRRAVAATRARARVCAHARV